MCAVSTATLFFANECLETDADKTLDPFGLRPIATRFYVPSFRSCQINATRSPTKKIYIRHPSLPGLRKIKGPRGS